MSVLEKVFESNQFDEKGSEKERINEFNIGRAVFDLLKNLFIQNHIFDNKGLKSGILKSNCLNIIGILQLLSHLRSLR